MRTEEMCPQSGNFEGTTAMEVSSDPTSPANGENTMHYDIYQISPTSFMRIYARIGLKGKQVVERAIKIARLIDASRIPMPYQVIFEEGRPTTIQCDKRFETVKKLPPLPLINETEAFLADIGVTTLVIMRNGWDSNLYVDYGRIGRVEFMANVHCPIKDSDR